MERNSIIAAPVIFRPMSLHQEWHSRYDGTRRDFLRFLTTPGPGRDRFLGGRECGISNVGSVVTPVYRP